MNKMTPQQQVLGVPKIQLQEYEGQAIYTGLHLMMMMMTMMVVVVVVMMVVVI